MPIYKYYTAQGCLAQGFTVLWKNLFQWLRKFFLKLVKKHLCAVSVCGKLTDWNWRCHADEGGDKGESKGSNVFEREIPLYILCKFWTFFGNFSNGLIFGNNYLVNGMKNLTKILFLCWLKFERVSYLYLLVDFDLIIKTSQLEICWKKRNFHSP